METAIAYSCNCFVAHAAERFAPGEFATTLDRAGFTRGTRLAQGDGTRLQALGEENVLATAADLAMAYRWLALYAAPSVLAGLEGAVEYGTAQLAKVEGASLAGKTGSVRTVGGNRIAWFAGFCPSCAPRVAIAVMTAGYSGGADAATGGRKDSRGVSGRFDMKQAAALFAMALQLSAATLKVQVSGRVVEMPLEKYVAAVLAGEAGVFRSDEALKAMAVAARTYGIRMRGRHAAEGFDLCATTHCQRIDPDAVTARLQLIAERTAGEMLWYRGKLAFTPYSLDCGGRTEDVAAVWPDERAAYFEKPRGRILRARGVERMALVWRCERYRHGAAEAGIADAGADHGDSRGGEN